MRFLIKLESFLIKNQILEYSTDGQLLFTEDFLGLLENRLIKADCIINYIPNYRMMGNKVHLPILSEMELELKDDGVISTKSSNEMTVKMAIGEAKLIQLDLTFNSMVFDLQGSSLQTYLLDELEQAMINAIHYRLVNVLKDKGCTEIVSTFTDKWFKTFCAAYVKGKALLLIKSDMVSQIGVKYLEYEKGELTLLGQKVLVTDDPNFEGMMVIGRNDVVFIQSGQPELYVDEETGYRSNLIYLGNRFYCGFVIKNPQRCYHVKFE